MAMKRIQISNMALAINAMILKFKSGKMPELLSGFSLRHPYLEALRKKNAPKKCRMPAYNLCCVNESQVSFMNLKN